MKMRSIRRREDLLPGDSPIDPLLDDLGNPGRHRCAEYRARIIGRLTHNQAFRRVHGR
jgi:hypothetical protein